MSRGPSRSKLRWLRATARCALLLAGVGGAGCRPDSHVTETGLTGIELTVQFGGLPLDQIAMSGSSGGQAAFAEDTLPPAARPLAFDQETVVILLPEQRAGAEVRVRVDGLEDGDLAGSGQGYVVVQARAIVGLVITLGRAARCADGVVHGHAEECDDGNDASGDGCSPSCFVETGYTCTRPTSGPSRCAHAGSCDRACTGCCAGAACVTPATLAGCGAHGSTCMDCSVVGDHCSPDGQCTCGLGPECAPGLHCVGGSCVCDEVGCAAGCCLGNVCASGKTQAACGTAGLACDACDPTTRCLDGVCGCDASMCPTGCCSGATCVPSSFSSCGGAGGACMACSPERADDCSPSGACTCGGGPACEDGQRCAGGVCTCDLANCPTGCCDASRTCVVPSLAACGATGDACTTCDVHRADACVDGGCRCGDTAACSPGQRCAAGTCVCDLSSCPAGCCDGATCSPRTLQSCGIGGSTCTACDPATTSTCSTAGTCQCGAGPPCGPGQRCAGGTCVCDQLSCPGCCAGIRCLAGDTAAACGAAGVDCAPCTAPDTCSAGVCSGCNASSCAGGCCTGSTCQPPSVSFCGVDAAPCVSCDPVRADTCSASGGCTCGLDPPCESGQRCFAGNCLCDAISCPGGCCADSACTAPAAATCGTGGDACATCAPTLADGCALDGTCRCGAQPACAAGQLCEGGLCVCNATSCPSGCCVNDACYSQSVQKCGTAGEACAVCDPTLADTCAVTGTCQCGAGPPCAVGQLCSGGACACDPASCAGCCGAETCLAGKTDTSCGKSGAACTDCTASGTTCLGGQCR